MMSPLTERCESTQSEIHTCNKGDGVTHILNRLCKSDLALTTTGRGREGSIEKSQLSHGPLDFEIMPVLKSSFHN